MELEEEPERSQLDQRIAKADVRKSPQNGQKWFGCRYGQMLIGLLLLR